MRACVGTPLAGSRCGAGGPIRIRSSTPKMPTGLGLKKIRFASSFLNFGVVANVSEPTQLTESTHIDYEFVILYLHVGSGMHTRRSNTVNVSPPHTNAPKLVRSISNFSLKWLQNCHPFLPFGLAS